MGKEIEEQSERDRQHLEMMAIASNQHTNSALLDQLQKERDEPVQEPVDWVAPENQEEVDAILEDFGAIM